MALPKPPTHKYCKKEGCSKLVVKNRGYCKKEHAPFHDLIDPPETAVEAKAKVQKLCSKNEVDLDEPSPIVKVIL